MTYIHHIYNIYLSSNMQLCSKIFFEFKLFNLIDFEIETMKFRGHI